MGTLRFFEEVVSFKIRRTFGFADYTGAVETVVADFDRRTGCRQFGGERDRDGFSVVPSRSGFIRRRIGGASAEENQSGRCEGKGIDYAVHKFDGFN